MAFAAAFTGLTTPSLDAHFLWRVETENVSYLYGTIHSADPSVHTLPVPVVDALKTSESFHPELELSFENIGRMAAAIVTPAAQRDLETGDLKEELPPHLWEKLQRNSRQLGIPAGLLRRIPVQLTPLLFAAPPGADFNRIVDVQVYKLARENDLDIQQLETIDEQVGIFQALEPDEAIVLLEDALDEFENGFPTQEKMLRSYAAGDLETLQELIEEDISGIEMPQLEEDLITRRNRTMVRRLLPYLEEGGAFVAVGVAHMPGDEGMLALLEEQGYTITRVPLKEAEKSERKRRRR